MDRFPFCIRSIIERHDLSSGAVSRIREVFPYWSDKDLHRAALVDRAETKDPGYRAKLDDLIEFTKAA